MNFWNFVTIYTIEIDHPEIPLDYKIPIQRRK